MSFEKIDEMLQQFPADAASELIRILWPYAVKDMKKMIGQGLKGPPADSATSEA